MLRSLIKIFFLNIKARYWHSDYITYSTSLISKVVVMIKWCKSVCLESSKCCEGFLLIMIMMVMMMVMMTVMMMMVTDDGDEGNDGDGDDGGGDSNSSYL